MCKIKNCPFPNYQNELCFYHNKEAKKPSKASIKRKEKKEYTKKQFELFLEIWNERGGKSEVSGEIIYGEPLSIYHHHILPKRNYPEAALDKENIIILTFDEHSAIESFPNKYEEINKRREKLL